MVEVLVKDLVPCKFNEDYFSDLIKDDYNSLKNDIEKNGIKVELHITKNNMILCGHQRYKIAKELKIEKVRCKIINIDDKDEFKIKEYIIIDNLLRRHLTTEQKYICIAELSKLYEIGKGAKEFRGNQYKSGKKPNLGSLPKNDDVLIRTSKVVGVSKNTIQRAREYKKIIDKKPELKKEKVSVVLANEKKEKHINKIKENIEDIKPIDSLKIYNSNCLKEIDNLKNSSIACVLIDPPYGIDYQSNYKLAKYDKIDFDDKKAFKLLDNSLEKVKSKMLKDSHIYIFSTWKVFDKVKPIIEKYFELKNVLIWNKNNWSMGDLEGNYAEKYEMIFFATKGDRKILSNKRPVNVLDFDRTTNSNHPTEKPVDLLKELITNSTLEGEIVLDFFAGSGSTGVACKELKRNFIGIELEKEYFDTMKFRLYSV